MTNSTTPPYWLIFNPHARRKVGPGVGLITVEPAERDPADPSRSINGPVAPVGGWFLTPNGTDGERVYADNPAHALRIPGRHPALVLAPGETWHVPGDPDLILDCGHLESPHSENTSGYGTLPDGKRHCLACCYAADLARMAKGPITAYLSTAPDGSHVVSTWSGQILAYVSDLRTVSCGGFLSGHRRTVWRATGVDGLTYHGTGPGPGMYTTVRLSIDKRRRYF